MRTVPTDNRSIGEVARGSEPLMRQVFLTGDQTELDDLARQVRKTKLTVPMTMYNVR